MRYRFNLEALRRYRQYQEDRLQKELADEQRHLEQAVAVLTQSIAQRDKAEKDLQRYQGQAPTSAQITVFVRFLHRMDEEIKAQRLKVADIEKACGQKRQALLVAMKKRKALDKLKEKGLKNHQAKMNKEEEKFIAEMAINRFTLNRR